MSCVTTGGMRASECDASSLWVLQGRIPGWVLLTWIFSLAHHGMHQHPNPLTTS